MLSEPGRGVTWPRSAAVETAKDRRELIEGRRNGCVRDAGEKELVLEFIASSCPVPGATPKRSSLCDARSCGVTRDLLGGQLSLERLGEGCDRGGLGAF